MRDYSTTMRHQGNYPRQLASALGTLCHKIEPMEKWILRKQRTHENCCELHNSGSQPPTLEPTTLSSDNLSTWRLRNQETVRPDHRASTTCGWLGLLRVGEERHGCSYPSLYSLIKVVQGADSLRRDQLPDELSPPRSLPFGRIANDRHSSSSPRLDRWWEFPRNYHDKGPRANAGLTIRDQINDVIIP